MDSMHNFKVFSQVWLDLVMPIGSNWGFNSFTSPSLLFSLLPALFCFFDLVGRSVDAVVKYGALFPSLLSRDCIWKAYSNAVPPLDS